MYIDDVIVATVTCVRRYVQFLQSAAEQLSVGKHRRSDPGSGPGVARRPVAVLSAPPRRRAVGCSGQTASPRHQTAGVAAGAELFGAATSFPLS